MVPSHCNNSIAHLVNLSLCRKVFLAVSCEGVTKYPLGRFSESPPFHISFFAFWNVNTLVYVCVKLPPHSTKTVPTAPTGGGGLTVTWYMYVPAFWGAFSRNLIWRSVGFHQIQRSPNYINWVYFEKIIVKKPPLRSKLCVFYRKWYIDR